MSINDFRTKSKEGGFDCASLSDSEILLNPKSFQAVGKVEGWEEHSHAYGMVDMSGWHSNMHRMIDALAEGKTIEQYLESLTSTSMN